SSPNPIAFIDIPGNMDLAVSENIMYADMYGDLVALDISDPKNVKLVKIIESAFPERQWLNGFFISGNGQMIVAWNKKDTTVTESCRTSGVGIFTGRHDVFFQASGTKSNVSVSPVGMGGSMARFTIAGNYLYTVDNHSLKCFSISYPVNPVKKNDIMAGIRSEE